MFQRILVPLDGSVRAEQALSIAARLARASGGTLILLQAIDPMNEFIAYVTLEPIPTHLSIQKEVAQAQRSLKQTKEAHDLSDVATETIVEVGPVATTILSTATALHCDLVVICSHGYTGITRWALGSVAEKVLHHSANPVLLLREGTPTLVGSTPHKDAFRVLVPLDGSEAARSALQPAAQLVIALAGRGQGVLHLTRVVPPSQIKPLSVGEREALLQKLRHELSLTADELQEQFFADYACSVTWSLIEHDDIAGSIVSAEENGEDVGGAGVFGRCDAIAMATYGTGGVQRLLMGSISERVLRASALPLLLVRPALVAGSHAP